MSSEELIHIGRKFEEDLRAATAANKRDRGVLRWFCGIMLVPSLLGAFGTTWKVVISLFLGEIQFISKGLIPIGPVQTLAQNPVGFWTTVAYYCGLAAFLWVIAFSFWRGVRRRYD